MMDKPFGYSELKEFQKKLDECEKARKNLPLRMAILETKIRKWAKAEGIRIAELTVKENNFPIYPGDECAYNVIVSMLRVYNRDTIAPPYVVNSYLDDTFEDEDFNWLAREVIILGALKLNERDELFARKALLRGRANGRDSKEDTQHC